MTSGGSGAVFFLGTRAHYQVLNPPESRFDVENGNTSTETIYQNPTVQDLYKSQQEPTTASVQELWPAEQKVEVDNERWGYCEQTITITEERNTESGKKKCRRTSETALCDGDELKPALLNSVDNSTPQKKSTKTPLLTFLWSLARRKRKLETDEVQYLHHIDSALTSCTYRESCRCLDCQSRYFECDDSDEEYSSDDSYVPRYVTQVMDAHENHQEEDEDDDDEVFIDTAPGDNASTDLLLDNTKMSVSSDETSELTQSDAEHKLQLEVAAGTPVLLNYLLTHPMTCSIQ